MIRQAEEQSSLASKAEGPKALKKHCSHYICMLVVFSDQFNKLKKEDLWFCQRITGGDDRDRDRYRDRDGDGDEIKIEIGR